MARFTRIQVAQQMAQDGMIPLFYHRDIEVCKKILTACYKGGARLLEFTNRGDYAHELFRELNQFCERALPDMILGIGSIADAGTTSLYIQLGANFIVTPALREDIAKTCNRRKIAWMSGCGSLSEIGQAEEWGAEIVKLFPGNVYGADLIKGAKAPQPWTNIMPTGGVSPDYDNLKMWLDAGAFCVGMGSQLMAKNELGEYDYEKIEALTKQSLGYIKEIRQKD